MSKEVTIDSSGLSPLARKAIEFMAALEPRAEGESAPTVEEYLNAYIGRAIESWKEAAIEHGLPDLRPLAKRFLNLTPEQTGELLAHLDEIESESSKTSAAFETEASPAERV